MDDKTETLLGSAEGWTTYSVVYHSLSSSPTTWCVKSAPTTKFGENNFSLPLAIRPFFTRGPAGDVTERTRIWREGRRLRRRPMHHGVAWSNPPDMGDEDRRRDRCHQISWLVILATLASTFPSLFSSGNVSSKWKLVFSNPTILKASLNYFNLAHTQLKRLHLVLATNRRQTYTGSFSLTGIKPIRWNTRKMEWHWCHQQGLQLRKLA